MTRIDPADIAVLQSLRDALMACNAAHTQDFAYQSGGAYGEVSDTFLRVAAKLLGTVDAPRLLDLTIECGENIEHCLEQMYPTPKLYVALLDEPGRDTRAVCVFADSDDAANWAINLHGAGMRWFEAVDYIPAKADALPEGADAKMIAWDLSDAFAKTEDDHHLDLSMTAIEKALPAIIAAIRAAE
jgi:hypothetical protein